MLTRIKKMNKGALRILLVISVGGALSPLIMGIVAFFWFNRLEKILTLEGFIVCVLYLVFIAVLFITFWLLVRLVLWIIDGFSE